MDSDNDDFDLKDEDLMDAFSGGRKRRKFSKEQAIYGVWAESEDEENEASTIVAGDTTIINNPINFELSSSLKKSELHDVNILKQPTSIHIDNRSKKDRDRIRNEKKSKNIGTWDQHTTGFGMKMLLKMGYKMGKGLGKEESGIVEPIQATLRQKRSGLGADGPELDTKTAKSNDFEMDSLHKDPQKTIPSWKKSSKKKVYYKTLEEINRDSEKIIQDNSLSNVKVIDMRGKHAQIHDDYDTLFKLESEKKKRLFRHFDIPELVLNLKQLVKLSEDKISTLCRKKRANLDLLVSYSYELESLEKQLSTTSNESNKIVSIAGMLENCIISAKINSRNSMNPVEALNYNLNVLEKLVNFSEYFEYGLSSLCGPLFVSWIDVLLRDNNILQWDNNVFEFFKQWCEFAQQENEQRVIFNISNTTTSSYDVYEKVLWFTLLPPLKNVINNYTKALTFSTELVDYLNKWIVLFPKWFRQHLFIHLIYPKLKYFVDQWNPRGDISAPPIHEWIHPWIPLLEDRFEITDQLFYMVQMKLCTIIKQWHPSDLSVKNMLIPWLDKFSDKSIQNILQNMIIPKLERLLLNDLEINPSDQDIEPFNLFLHWYSVVPDKNMIELLNRHFFPKWHSILHYWLKQEGPNFEEIAIWYKGWKSLFPKALIEFDSVKKNLSLALHMINFSSQGIDIGNTFELFVARYEDSQRKIEPTPAPIQQSTIKVSNFSSNNFKDIIEQFASERGILFRPINSSINYSDGKTYYQFGSSIIFIDRGVIFVKTPTVGGNQKTGNVPANKHKWHPTSLQELIDDTAQQQ